MLRVPDSLIGLIFMIGGLAVVVTSWQMEGMAGLGVGPGTLPLIVGAGFILFGGALVLQGLPEIRSLHKGETSLVEQRSNAWFPLIVIVALAAYTMLLPIAGFIPMTAIFIIVIVLASGGTLMSSVLFAAVSTAIIQITFSHLLRVPLPSGLLG